MATPTYSNQQRQNIINKNIRPLTHPYYTEYTNLQKICLQISRHESLKFGEEKDKIYGVLFDGAWLWEEYLWTILEPLKFEHPENNKHTGGRPMFEKPKPDDNFEDGETIDKNSRKLYPDFWRDDFIVDAKYKHLEKGVGREDLYQVATYMFCTEAKNGGYIYPTSSPNQELHKFKLSGYGDFMYVIPMHIPQSGNWQDFNTEMSEEENKLK